MRRLGIRVRAVRTLGLPAVAGLLVAACTANPPPPIQSTETTNPTTAPSTRTSVIVAIDDVGIGFNPHLAADLSPTTVALTSMVLPGAFTPTAASATDPTSWVLNKAVMVSADVTSTAPFTVTYKIRNEAQWSDGPPIAAEDFVYLWQQMTHSAGTVDRAGYDLIDDVSSAAGGKTVIVKFKGPYPAWPRLFSALLPSHSLKDSPGGFARGLTDGIPVSGGPFKIKNVDRGRDEILLERNDRYWDVPATPDQVLLRRAGTAPQLAEAMRTGDAQVAAVHVPATARAQLNAIPGVSTGISVQPRVLEFTLNTRSPTVSDPRVRAGLLSLLDPNLLASVGTGGRSDVEPARAMILAPSDPGYVPTAPARLVLPDALGQLTAAGYVIPPPPTQAGQPISPITKDGKPFTLRIGAPVGDDIATTVASTATDQLRAVGIEATVVKLAPEELFGTALARNDVDAVVGWVAAGMDPATALMSRFGCPADARPSTPEAPSNVSGACDPALQKEAGELLHGVGNYLAQNRAIDAKLWALNAVLPIVQDAVVAAIGSSVTGVSLAGPVQTGIFQHVNQWNRER